MQKVGHKLRGFNGKLWKSVGWIWTEYPKGRGDPFRVVRWYQEGVAPMLDYKEAQNSSDHLILDLDIVIVLTYSLDTDT